MVSCGLKTVEGGPVGPDKPNLSLFLMTIVARPDTRQVSRGRLARGRNAKITRNSEIFVTYRRTDVSTYRRTDVPTRQCVESRVRD